MDEVYKVVNRKVELGHVPLREEIGAVERVRRALDKEGIEFTLVGGSAIGTVIPVTGEWMAQRRVSRLIDIDMDFDSRDTALRVLEGCGWKADDPAAYFGIQWGHGSSMKSMCTIENEDILVGRSGFYLSPVTGITVPIAEPPTRVNSIPSLSSALRTLSTAPISSRSGT